MNKLSDNDKLNTTTRDRIIDEILDDVVANFWGYKDFIMDCVKETISKWEDEELLDWIKGE